MRLLHEARVPVIPRAPAPVSAVRPCRLEGGVVVCLSRMKRILEIDLENRRAVVEPGVVNLWLTRAVEDDGFHFAPDPSSQGACTIGGNVATNSGGPHTLKYGVTVNHVLGVEMVLPDGTVVELGGDVEDNPGYDLTGLIVGHEGTFGIVTKAIVRLTRAPQSLPDAARRLRHRRRRDRARSAR